MTNTPKPTIQNSLPVVQRVNIQTPCPKNWDEMDGDAAKRFCGHCQKHVHNFSEMDSETVTELLSSGQSICAKICRNTDGTIVTKERTLTRRRWLANLTKMAASIAAIVMLGGCRKDEVIQGEIDVDVSDEVTGIVAPSEPMQTMGEATIEEEMGDVAVLPEDLPVRNPDAPTSLMGKAIVGGQPK